MDTRDASPRSTTSTLSNITVRTDKHADARARSSASPSMSTPPTSLDDEASIKSEANKHDQAGEANGEAVVLQTPDDEAQGVADTPPGTSNTDGRRSARNSRKSVTTYNVQILAGTAIHTPTKYLEKHHKTVVHGSLEDLPKRKREVVTPAKKRSFKRRSTGTDVAHAIENQLSAESAQAARRRSSVRATDLRKDVLRSLSGVGDAVAKGGKLRRSASEPRLQSSKSSSSAASRKRSRNAADEDEEQQNDESQEEKEYLKPKTKTWLKQGLFVGQHREFNPRLSETQNRAKRRNKPTTESRVLPLPLFTCDRLLNEDPRHVFRDFKLPFDTYNPLPRKVKVDGWVKLGKNRFIGDASALWKRDKQDTSQCYCDPEDGCGEACHNRIMAYECDGTNCPLTAGQCGNRPFAELRRRAKGNRYDYGVEVVDTEDRGYGVRAMRTFEPHQVIVEYAGEIITQSECERRMKQVYKKDKCYYLMSFDSKMIIDATRGTIARFVNHSCEPNCEMIKWTVGGEPRMALFAGRRGIMTGEELTYDYNFDPFSQKNIQECRCGTESCRGVLGPKPKKPIEEKSFPAALISGTKRKLQALFGSGASGSDSRTNSPKKRKLTVGEVKVRNAALQLEAARQRVEKEADEHERQIESRENRALKRNNSGLLPRRRSNMLRSKPAAIKVTKRTTVTFKRQVLKADIKGAVKKVVKKPAQRKPSALKRKGPQTPKRPVTPVQDSSSEESEDESPNITPASLRSASGKSSLFSPLSHERIGSRGPSNAAKKQAARPAKPFTLKALKQTKRGATIPASRGLRKTGAGVKKSTQSKLKTKNGKWLLG